MVGTALLMEQVSFALPAALLMYQCRDARFLPQESHHNMGLAGWTANAVVVAWTSFGLFIYSFPTLRPVMPGNMNEYSPSPPVQRL